MKITKIARALSLCVAIGAYATLAPTPSAQAKTKMVGGAAMSPKKTIVENAANSRDHTTLVTAVIAADLAGMLSSPGPFTVLAPTNEAFGKLPTGTVGTLLKPENGDALASVLAYHVIVGNYSATEIGKLIKKGDGKAELKTVQGELLTFTRDGKQIIVTDSKGGTSNITIADVKQSNGVIHVVDGVLMP